VRTRRPAPTILLTALTATLLLLPWALDCRSDDATASAPTPETGLTEQPLAGLGAGATIREIGQARPFSMVALTGTDLTGTSARVRAKRTDGSWGPWYESETLRSGTETGAGSGPGGTEPVFVGATTSVQIDVRRPEGAPVTSAPPRGRSGKPPLGYRPATVEHPWAQNISAVLISIPRSPREMPRPLPTGIIPPGQPPYIISRAEWGANEAVRCGRTQYDPAVRAAVIHHTAENNDYAPEDSAGIVQAIYAYHTRTLGWCDIAYNALVDKYGQVFEGRAGGITRPVQGAHTGGFNRETWGVAMIGNFDDVPPSPIQLRNVGRLLGWRMGLARVDPLGAAPMVSEGGSHTHFPRGATPMLPAIFAHRDVGITDCPGNAGYAALDEIRATAAQVDKPPRPEELAESMQGGAIHSRWQELGAMDGLLGAPTSPESAGENTTRYATFDRGALYWSP
jgi:uncharacterized protein with LGFP repeats